MAVVVGLAAGRADAARRDVLLVVNTRVPDSQVVADAYRALRDIPDTHVVRVDVAPDAQVSRADYLARLEVPVLAWLVRHAAQDEIAYVVLSRGLPLTIAPDAPTRMPLVSVDSSLTLLYRKLLGAVVGPGPLSNPYFTQSPGADGWPAFARTAHDTYLVSRLDGFTLDDALALAKRCPATAPAARSVVLDAVVPGAAPEHRWFTQAADRVRVLPSTTVELDQTAQRVSGRTDVIGYYGWGAADPSQRDRSLGLTLAPGAIGASLSATEARTLATPPTAWQPGAWQQRDRHFAGSSDALAGDRVRAGFTGWAGAVADPLVEGLVRPHVVLPAYLSGRSLGEAYALATRHIGWRMVVFGDPLCRPFGPEPPPTPLTRDERSGLTGPFRDRLLALAERAAPRASRASLEVQVDARARVQQGERERGLALLRAHVADHADDLPALQLLALLLDPALERDEALRTYRAVLAARPADVVSANNLAFALAEDPASHAEALQLARRAYEATRGEPTIADTYGWVLYQAGDDAQAIRVLGEAVRRNPRLADAHLHLALAQLRAGQQAEARRSWDAALAIDAALSGRREAAPLVAAFPPVRP